MTPDSERGGDHIFVNTMADARRFGQCPNVERAERCAAEFHPGRNRPYWTSRTGTCPNAELFLRFRAPPSLDDVGEAILLVGLQEPDRDDVESVGLSQQASHRLHVAGTDREK